ncbi:hypothetical protein BCR37DRAFT_375877 [Protomyces lactucae-debilis]|uniref:Uncharacterized protein n=1 Tax=Protomyces lactucae-debilis TaxID=2754530 RepID=A0A1Y2FV97_PROLT|nr:uncharacterized protein BCR37DRAFT_375877 [Protomyces lactucae-debilis]ORY87918.1 hypothetical protein BCR37DRAFT_375877 [Protomyces lactucae-debilis]
MFKLALPMRARAFTTVRSLRKDGPAKAFEADGKIGSQFSGKEGLSKAVDENIGGPFSKDGAIGKHFTKEGAVGGKVQEAAEEADKKDGSTIVHKNLP